MRRRDFVAGFGITAAWRLALRAQPSQKLSRIGVLNPEISIASSGPSPKRRREVRLVPVPDVGAV